MKKILIPILLLSLIIQPAQAKVGSGGQATPANTEQAEQPTPQLISEPAPEETESDAERMARIRERANQAAKEATPTPEPTPTPVPATTKKASSSTQILPDSITNVILHCGELEDHKERIKCRLGVYNKNLSDSERKDKLTMLQLENKTAYLPEGCRRGSDTWQESCKERYKAIGSCWYDEDYERSENAYADENEYEGEEVVMCLKSKLKIPNNLKHISEQCEEQDESCKDEYKKTVHHLIVARFYDAEERAEILLEEERVSQDNAIDFITFIGEQKIAFYDATTKEQRKSVIQKVIDEWKNFISNVK